MDRARGAVQSEQAGSGTWSGLSRPRFWHHGLTVAAVALIVGLSACAPKPDAPVVTKPTVKPLPPPAEGAAQFTPVSFYHLPGWFKDPVADVLPALKKSCQVFLDRPETQSVGDGRFGTVADWMGPCRAADRLNPTDHTAARAFFEAWFEPYLVTQGNQADGLFTGYYEAELHGSWRRDDTYSTPIYGPPSDMVSFDVGGFDPALKGKRFVGRLKGKRLVPYPTRAEIDNGAIEQFSQPILWVNDPVDSFFLHIQGSGRVRMTDGSVVRLGYAANNGHGFVGIGGLMLKRGLIEKGKGSMQSIRQWLRDNPKQAAALMAENPRYIFFRVITGGDGPIGSQGIALTAGRSLAVDPAFIPLGVPLWLDTTTPDGTPLRRLMMAQDTGKAIKGAVRGDFFWGFGEAALAQAGRMKSAGRYYLLIPRQRSVPVALAGD